MSETGVIVTGGLGRLGRALAEMLERRGVAALLTSRDPELPALLQALLDDSVLRGQAIRGLARFEAPGSAEAILKIYPELNATEKRDALNTLASRVTYARPLLTATARALKR